MAVATEYARMARFAKNFQTVGAAGYVDAAAYAVPIQTTVVAGYAARGSPVGNIRQYASDGLNEPTICSINARFDTASIADGARRIARQTDPAWADVASAGLYLIAGSEQGSDIAEVMYLTHPGQYQLS